MRESLSPLATCIFVLAWIALVVVTGYGVRWRFDHRWRAKRLLARHRHRWELR